MDQKKPQLSGAILDMKFMKKSKERVEKELDDAEGNAMYSNEITDQMRKGQRLTVKDVSINNCKDLCEGRLSFGGINPEIERIMTEENAKRKEKIDKEKETDVSDLEMAKRYNPLVETLGKKLNKKQKNNNKQFRKPVDT